MQSMTVRCCSMLPQAVLTLLDASLVVVTMSTSPGNERQVLATCRRERTEVEDWVLPVM
jgi:hypothetical protein